MADDKARPAAPLTLPDTGRTTVDDKLFFETERLSYQCADALAARIAVAVVQHVRDKTVVIVGTAVMAEFGRLSPINRRTGLAVLLRGSTGVGLGGEAFEPGLQLQREIAGVVPRLGEVAAVEP